MARGRTSSIFHAGESFDSYIQEGAEPSLHGVCEEIRTCWRDLRAKKISSSEKDPDGEKEWTRMILRTVGKHMKYKDPRQGFQMGTHQDNAAQCHQPFHFSPFLSLGPFLPSFLHFSPFSFHFSTQRILFRFPIQNVSSVPRGRWHLSKKVFLLLQMTMPLCRARIS